MLWRSRKPTRLAPRVPVGFVKTCQPVLSPAPPAGTDWLHEVKHDGYRVIARKESKRVRIWSRHMTDFTDHFAGIAEALRQLPGSVVLDGEAVIFRADGHSDFDALRDRSRAKNARLVAFDLIEQDGCDLRRLAIEQRREALTELMMTAPEAIVLSQAIEGEADVIFRHACAMGLEGIISKRLGSRYRAGRCSDWLKIKNPKFVRGELWRSHGLREPV